MQRQAPIAQCFVALCFSAAITLAAIEWRNPFPESVETLSAAPHLSEEGILPVGGDAPRRFQRLSQRLLAQVAGGPSSTSQPNSALQASNTPPSEAAQLVQANRETSTYLVLSLAARSLEVHTPGKPTIRYEVAVGQDDWQTPTGNFTVLNKLESPTWQHPITKEQIAPGPENPLGTHWIGFWRDGQAQIGFHGTNQEALIGQAVSHGCVRMRNRDIKDLYQRVTIDTQITVEP